MDTNSDGLIDTRDLSQMLANLGVPIDEAILSHVMLTASKRATGDHRISEPEFIEWIGHFIQVSDAPPAGSSADSRGGAAAGSAKKAGSGRRARSKVVRCQTAGSSLAAQPAEAPPPRQRRGSGSGLALMRSLATGSGGPPSRAAEPQEEGVSEEARVADAEARNDLKAAFCVFDLDGDGYITLDEVRAGLKLLGESWSPAELGQLFSSYSPRLRASPADLSEQRISIDDFVQLLL